MVRHDTPELSLFLIGLCLATGAAVTVSAVSTFALAHLAVTAVHRRLCGAGPYA